MSSSQVPSKPENIDSLEYFIKFPTPNFKNTDSSGESDYVFVCCNETNVPIVILLGWAGCQDRYLMKYSKIYEDRGLITVRYTAPVENLFWKRSSMIEIGVKILKLIYDMNFDSHPIIFHVFSNGGAFLYQHIVLAMENQKKSLQIKGMIFDSAPGERRIVGLYRAIAVIYGKDKTFSSIIASLISASLVFIWICEESFNAIKNIFYPGEPLQAHPMQFLENEMNTFPQMFLYSKEDDVIPYMDIENFAEHRRKQGINVTKMCFVESEHVKHFIRHPQLYIHCICKFINDCLSSIYRNGNNTKLD